MRRVAAVLLLCSCSSLSSAPPAAPQVVVPGEPVCTVAWGDMPMTMQSWSGTYVSDDPQATMSRFRSLVLERGGEVQYASSSPGSGSVTARFPVDGHGFAGVDVPGASVAYESSSSSDYRPTIVQGCARLATVERALATPTTGDAEVQGLVRELLQRERDNLVSSLQSEREQVRWISVSASFSQTQ